MDRKALAVFTAVVLLAGCSWVPWSGSSGDDGAPRTPAGATAYACEGGKRLLVRFESDAKSAWVIYPDREFRLDRIASASGERFSNGSTTLATRDGEATLEESGAVLFAKCKRERTP